MLGEMNTATTTLYQYIPAWEQPDISPFCIKLETYFRMAEIPFQTAVGQVNKAPKKKLPYIVDGDGTVLCDSRDIIAHFEAKHPAPLDRGLSLHDQATARAFRALLEEEAYFYAFYLLWHVDENFQLYLPVLREYGTALGLPRWLLGFVFKSSRKQALRDLWGQGVGRHTRDEVGQRLCEAIEALSLPLDGKAFFFGDRPRVIDATCYGFLRPLIGRPFDMQVQARLRANANLMGYLDRIQQRYFEG